MTSKHIFTHIATVIELNNEEMKVTKEECCHATGTQMIVDPTLAPPINNINKRHKRWHL